MPLEVFVKKQESLPPADVGSDSSLYPSEATLSELGEFLVKRLDTIRKLREDSKWEQEKAMCYRSYYMVPKQRSLPYPGAANLPSPIPRIIVDSFHANVMASLYVRDNLMNVVPVIIQKEFANRADKVSKYMTYCMNHEANSYEAIDDADLKAQMYGIGYLEPSYEKEEMWESVEKKETKREPMPDPITGEITFKEKTTTRQEKKKRTVFDGVRIKSLPIESIYKNPFLLSLEQSVKDDFVFKTPISISWDDVLYRSKKTEDKPAFYRKSQVDKLKSHVLEKVYKQLNKMEQARADQDGFYIDFLSRGQVLELAQGYGWYDIDGDGIKEEINVTFHPATGTVLRVVLSPCRIVEIIPRPLDGRGYGQGVPKITEWLDDEWENFHNTRSNAGQWEHMPFGFYRAGGKFNPQTITIQPGHFYPIDDPREVSFPNTQRVGASYFQEEQLLMNYVERIFGLDENMQGIGSQRRRTATESLKVANRSSVRFGNPFNRTVGSINKLLKHVWELSRECAPPDKEFYVVGEGGAPIFDKMAREDFSANMQFAVKVSSVFDQQTVRDSIMLAYRLFLENPLVQQHPASIWELSQKTLDTLQIDIDIPKPPQAQVVSAFEAVQMIKQGEPIEPEVGIDYDHHLKVCLKQLNADDIQEWDTEAVMSLALYIDKLRILKQTIESANLNKSGQTVPGQMPNQPGVTANRNPTQSFNTMRVGESGRSQVKNAQKLKGGGHAGQSMDQIMGPVS